MSKIAPNSSPNGILLSHGKPFLEIPLGSESMWEFSRQRMWTRDRVRAVFVATVLAAASTASANSGFYAKFLLLSGRAVLALRCVDGAAGDGDLPRLNYHLGCLHKCSKLQCCCLVCVMDSVCHLFDSKKARGWPGSDDAGALSFDACFTAWGAGRRQVVPVATSASSESQGSEAPKALNGLANGQCFASEPEAGSWWMADLGESKPVSEVRIRTALEGAGTAAPPLTAARLGTPRSPGATPLSGSLSGRRRRCSGPPSPWAAASYPCTVWSRTAAADHLPGRDHRGKAPARRHLHLRPPFRLRFSDRAVTAYCDLETDGGGWTVVQRRRDVLPREDFFRTWEEYVEGFGNVSSGEFWLDFQGDSKFAKYSSFSVSDRDDFYRLTVAGYSGTAGDALSVHNGMAFSAKDKDLDPSSYHCAESHLLKDNIQVSEPVDVIKNFRDHWQTVFYPHEPHPLFNEHFQSINTWSQEHRIETEPEPIIHMDRLDDTCELRAPILLEEIKQIIKRFPRKAPGSSQIGRDALLHLPDNVLRAMTHLYNTSLASGYFPAPFKTAIVALIPKPNKDLTDPKNYRPISLLETLGKIFESH
ncbi:putative tenascin-like [Penaeus vannamei]|uniref:Putative tenascin-like n=1 Tax=Penaeus vannamei TaxID=6689 RepID=A0A423TRF3_PENVA|nr:putative tenascin-like [Penaeus vannamei]